jgi:hypothetical protein
LYIFKDDPKGLAGCPTKRAAGRKKPATAIVVAPFGADHPLLVATIELKVPMIVIGVLT